MSMKFDNAEKVSEIVWDMRLADLLRGEDRTVLNRLYNGHPPYSEDEAKENNVEINRNDLQGVNALSQARRQWHNAFLKPGNYFSVALDSRPTHKRVEWSHTITRELNRRLKRRPDMIEQLRAKGGQAILHGLGPVVWKDRRSPIPSALPIASMMVPSETEVGFENLEYVALFRETTPSQLYDLTHGPKVDPGWNMDLVNAQMKYVATQIQKQPNATAYQYMPERIEELVKQDKGYFGSDAVPTVDWWDFYFREADDGEGWYRRIILDWDSGDAPQAKAPYRKNSRNEIDGKSHFLYTSGDKRYANRLSEFMHCQTADCSAVFPQKVHSIRSLGWMLWGICDLENRLHCKFNEAVFLSLMWLFRVSGNEQLNRLRQADFTHMGAVPQGIDFVKAQERYTPDAGLTTLAFARNRQLMSENAAAFTQDFDKGETRKEMTATETMARLNQVNSLVSGMLALAYTYEEFCYREICRRFCFARSRDRDVSAFRLACLKSGVPREMLDAERWDVTAERVLGGGNKTIELAQVQFLQTIRKNLNPDSQRRVDHICIESATDDPALAEELAPLAQQNKPSNSVVDAQFATDRILRGLPFAVPHDAVVEDYVLVWLGDLKALVGQMQNPMIPPTPERLAGAFALAQATEPLIVELGKNDEEKPMAKKYQKALKQLVGVLQKIAGAFQQRMKAQQANGAQAGGNGAAIQSKVQLEEAKTAAALKGKLLLDQTKAQNMSHSHASRTAQKQISFELEQQRKDRAAAADLRRKRVDHLHETALSGLRSLSE